MNLLAIDSGTEHLSIAVGRETTVWQYAGAGGARASTDLIAGVLPHGGFTAHGNGQVFGSRINRQQVHIF